MRNALFAAALALAACDVTIAGDGTVSGSMPGLEAKATRTDEAALDVKTGDTIDASSTFGRVRLRVDDSAKPSVTATFTVHAKTDEDAKRVLGTWKLVVGKSGDVSTVRAEGDTYEVELGLGKMKVSPEVELEIVVPSGLEARANSESGEVRVEGAFASVEAKTKFGKVGVAGARGDVVAETENGEARVEDVTAARVEASSQFGAVKLKKIVAGKVVARSENGAVTCEADGPGDYELRSSFGKVGMRGGKGTLSAKSQNGKVEVEGFDGKVVARSDFGAVEVEGVLTSADATSSNGAVKVSALAGSKADGPWTVRSEFGGVTLRVPDDFACELDLSTEFGSLKADHPGISRGPDRGAQQMKAKMGAGGQAVVVKTQNGSAKVETSR
jgi:DUF4097 and DUF4098 domain-containing protein YvlB